MFSSQIHIYQNLQVFCADSDHRMQMDLFEIMYSVTVGGLHRQVFKIYY